MGQTYLGLNGGPSFTFTEAVSFVVTCEDQAEIDRYWDRLTADGGEPGRCGWCKDRYGLSWQVVPAGLGELVRDDGARQALFGMDKIDIAALRAGAARRRRSRRICRATRPPSRPAPTTSIEPKECWNRRPAKKSPGQPFAAPRSCSG